MAKRTQTGDVLAHLIKYGKITTCEAYQKYGCTRLPSRIYDYRKDGYVIESCKKNNQNTLRENNNRCGVHIDSNAGSGSLRKE